jgi:hypothetical protein
VTNAISFVKASAEKGSISPLELAHIKTTYPIIESNHPFGDEHE